MKKDRREERGKENVEYLSLLVCCYQPACLKSSAELAEDLLFDGYGDGIQHAENMHLCSTKASKIVVQRD